MLSTTSSGMAVADFVPPPGTQRMIDEAHARGLRVIVDLVPNHFSTAHPWFHEALAAPPGSPERARFHFRDGRGPNGDEPPNNWASLFTGSGHFSFLQWNFAFGDVSIAPNGDFSVQASSGGSVSKSGTFICH